MQPVQAEEEAQRLRTIIDEMDSEVNKIRMNQATLRRRVNELLSSPRHLPHEVLAEIFFCVCADRYAFRTPALKVSHPLVQVLSRVCSGWRQVTRSTPSLWTRVDVEMPNYEWATIGSFNILRLHLENAAALPVGVVIGFSSLELAVPEGYYVNGGHYVPYTQLLRFLFSDSAAKLGSFTIRGQVRGQLPRSWLTTIASYTTGDDGNSEQIVFPNLVNLHLPIVAFQARPLDQPLFETTTIPHLRRLILHSQSTMYKIPFDNLTMLHIRDIPFQEALNTLTRLPQLHEIHARHLRTSTGSGRGSYNKPPRPLNSRSVITLDRLRVMAWDVTDSGWTNLLMNNFRFSALVRLFCHHDKGAYTLTDTWTPPKFEENWVRFLSSLPALQCYGHDVSKMSRAATEALYRATGHISGTLDELHLWGRFPGSMNANPPIKGIFFRHFTLSQTPLQGIDILHPIRAKEVHLYEDYPVFLSYNADGFLDMLESRQNALYEDGRRWKALFLYTTSPFVVPVERPGIWEHWTQEQRVRLDMLVEEGLVIKMREGVDYSSDRLYSSPLDGATCVCAGL